MIDYNEICSTKCAGISSNFLCFSYRKWPNPSLIQKKGIKGSSFALLWDNQMHRRLLFSAIFYPVFGSLCVGLRPLVCDQKYLFSKSLTSARAIHCAIEIPGMCSGSWFWWCLLHCHEHLNFWVSAHLDFSAKMAKSVCSYTFMGGAKRVQWQEALVAGISPWVYLFAVTPRLCQ